MDDSRTLDLEQLSLDDFNCIRDMILADFRTALTHSLSTATTSSNPPRVENNQSSITGHIPSCPTVLHQEIEMLKRKYDELEKDYQECRAEKSADDDRRITELDDVKDDANWKESMMIFALESP